MSSWCLSGRVSFARGCSRILWRVGLLALLAELGGLVLYNGAAALRGGLELGGLVLCNGATALREGFVRSSVISGTSPSQCRRQQFVLSVSFSCSVAIA